MKAKCVYENLEFERGQDPKKVLELGGIDYSSEILSYLDSMEERIRRDIEGKTVRASLYNPKEGGTDIGVVTLAKIISIDFNKHQEYLIELKIESIKNLEYNEFLEIIGVKIS